MRGEDDNGSFSSRMGDIRSRLLGVLGMDHSTAEVRLCSRARVCVFLSQPRVAVATYLWA